jgi:hypothetical protein
MNFASGGKPTSASTTTALQALRHVTSSVPRRLTASEIALLRQSKSEIGARVRQLAASR